MNATQTREKFHTLMPCADIFKPAGAKLLYLENERGESVGKRVELITGENLLNMIPRSKK